MNILNISPNFNLACGVSKSVFTLLTSDELKKEFNLHFITNGGDALQKLDKAGVNYSLINFRTDKILHYDFFRNLKWLKEYCLDKNINIIHSHHRYPAMLAHLAAKSLGIKTVVTVHNFVKRFKHFSYKADRIIAVSHAVKDHLNNYFKIPSNKVEVLYNCIIDETSKDFVSYGLKSSLKIPPDNKIILFAGRIIQEKGIDTIVDSFYLLSREFKAMELVLLGNNKIPKKILMKILRNNRIHLFPPTDKIMDYYKISDVVVLPSINEPLGYNMLEAGLFKIPFVGSKAGGIAEFIEDGINGYLFEPNNADDLANKIKYVLIHPKEALLTAEKLNEKVIRECNCEKYFEKLIRIYSTLLNY